MTAHEQTSRDQMDRFARLIRRAFRYTGVAVLIVAMGAAASVAFALSRAHGYESETTLLHRQLIPQGVVDDRHVRTSSQELAARYGELAVSRDTLGAVMEDLNILRDVAERHGEAAALEEMRERVDFADRGAGAFRISYVGDTPEEAERVTRRIADIVIEKDDALRRERRDATHQFLEAEKEAAESILEEREEALAAFIADNPEFADELGPDEPQGAWTRALRERFGGSLPVAADARLAALERQRDRIQDRIRAPDEARERQRARAERQVDSAEAELDDAERELELLRGRYTDRHPRVALGERRVATAERRLREAEAALPPGPAEGEELAELYRELQEVEREIASRRAELEREDGADLAPEDEDQHWVVDLETEFAGHLRDLEEARDRVRGLEHRLFTAEIQASSQAVASSELVVIDEAFEPAEPVGRSRRVIAAAGTMLFGGLALVLVFGLVLFDDRIYGRGELDQLGVGAVTVEVPGADRRSKSGSYGGK